MMKTSNKALLAMGTTLLTGLTSIAVQADTANVQNSAFEMTELSSGYMQLAAAETTTGTNTAKDKAPEAKCAGDKPMTESKAKEGKCGEGKCGDMKKPAADSTQKPADASKAKEGKSGDMKKPALDSTQKPADASKAKEGKCGEGKCGDMKKPAADSTQKPATSTTPLADVKK